MHLRIKVTASQIYICVFLEIPEQEKQKLPESLPEFFMKTDFSKQTKSLKQTAAVLLLVMLDRQH